MDLRAHFEPRSLALIGASADPLSISARPLRMLVQHGYPGRLYPINPKYAELQGLRVFPNIGAVPERVDLAIVAVPAPAVVPVLRECAQAGVRFAVVLSSGFAEAGPHGREMQNAIAEAIAGSGLRVNGPNAEGLYYPAGRVCATFSPALDPEHGFPVPTAETIATAETVPTSQSVATAQTVPTSQSIATAETTRTNQTTPRAKTIRTAQTTPRDQTIATDEMVPTSQSIATAQTLPTSQSMAAADTIATAETTPRPTPTPSITASGPATAETASIGVVSQSGGLGFAILNHGREVGLDFGAVVSTGNEVDLGWLDYASYLLEQPHIRVILGFVEGLRGRAEDLEHVAEKAAQLRKPIIIAKIGRTRAAANAAANHTGSDVGDDQWYDRTFRRLGIIRVEDVDEMLDLAAYFGVGRLPSGRRLGVLTTSGGAGAWLVDACATRGFLIPPPDRGEQDAIRSFIPSYGCTGNPVDITAQAVFGGGFERALGILLRSPEFDVVAGVGSMVREDRFLSSLPDLRAALDGSERAVVFYSYTRPSLAVVRALAELGIPCYTTPVRAARALAAAADYADFIRNRRFVQHGVD
ncbi:MAG: CoA-binding protein [Chloroflexi bacterium]|nr:CoA-binding protein [Chloroflexota bacterium]